MFCFVVSYLTFSYLLYFFLSLTLSPYLLDYICWSLIFFLSLFYGCFLTFLVLILVTLLVLWRKKSLYFYIFIYYIYFGVFFLCVYRFQLDIHFFIYFFLSCVAFIFPFPFFPLISPSSLST